MTHYKGLHFLPLGGAAEIGLNLNLYCYEGDWLMVDFGVSFDDQFGIDVIFPDPKFIVQHKHKLKGILLTHAHEDHIGAIPYLWSELECPVYATPFTRQILNEKLKDVGLLGQVEVIEIPLDGSVQIGPFGITMVRLTHSIPEPNGVLIETPLGRIFHTGDWKIDPDPLLGETTDVETLIRLGDEGVLAMVCDSTNVFNAKESGSEKMVLDNLDEVVSKYPESRIFVSCFASNVARMQSIARIALKHNRKIIFAGHSIGRMEQAARRVGYLQDIPVFESARNAKEMRDKETLVICTGSQGEGRAALKRMANGSHPDISIKEGDVIIFSSREIPGNEKRIGHLKNALIRMGCHIITQHQYDVHVSGHPSRDELQQMYEWIRPKIAIPIHGELRHLVEHGKLARKCGVEDVIIPDNGSLIHLAPEPADVVKEVHAGRLVLDGSEIVPQNHPAIRERQRLSYNGLAVITLVVDENYDLHGPITVETVGLVDVNDSTAVVQDALSDAYVDMPSDVLRDEQKVQNQLKRVAIRIFNQLIGKKPEILVSWHQVG